MNYFRAAKGKRAILAALRLCRRFLVLSEICHPSEKTYNSLLQFTALEGERLGQSEGVTSNRCPEFEFFTTQGFAKQPPGRSGRLSGTSFFSGKGSRRGSACSRVWLD